MSRTSKDDVDDEFLPQSPLSATFSKGESVESKMASGNRAKSASHPVKNVHVLPSRTSARISNARSSARRSIDLMSSSDSNDDDEDDDDDDDDDDDSAASHADHDELDIDDANEEKEVEDTREFEHERNCILTANLGSLLSLTYCEDWEGASIEMERSYVYINRTNKGQSSRQKTKKNFSIVREQLLARDAFGWTPLHWASQDGATVKLIKQMIEIAPEAINNSRSLGVGSPLVRMPLSLRRTLFNIFILYSH
jgi:hypothetical protein